MSCLASLTSGLLLFATVVDSMDPSHATNITVYHLNPLSAGGVPANMDTGDERGDLNFFIPQYFLPLACADPDRRAKFDCDNPERTDPNLVVTKVDMTVDSQYTKYSDCNLCTGHDPFTGKPCKNGTYSCDCGGGWDHKYCDPTRVGNSPPDGSYHCHANYSKAWDCWGANVDEVTGGQWYSTLAVGECKDAAMAGNCSWKANSIATVKSQCIKDSIASAVEHAGPSCFSACGARNMTSSCWINCFFDTLLGAGSSTSVPPTGKGMQIDGLVDVWKNAFSPVSEGGCPQIGDKSMIVV